MAGNGPCVSPATLTFRCSPSNQLVWNFSFLFLISSLLFLESMWLAPLLPVFFSRPGDVGFLSRDCVGGSAERASAFTPALPSGSCPWWGTECVSRTLWARPHLIECRIQAHPASDSCLIPRSLFFSPLLFCSFSFVQSYREVHQFMVIKSNRWVRDTNSPTTKKPIALSLISLRPPPP